ncbi:MAG: glutaredoxin family protein [Chloroflexi bacterium]|nr:glutaredoxin family protein [Chloroflexota bacterium]
MAKQVVVYTQTFDCVFCDSVKEYLSRRGVPYIERDVNSDDRAMEELEQMGCLTTPVVLVDDEAVVGFDLRRLEQLLG